MAKEHLYLILGVSLLAAGAIYKIGEGDPFLESVSTGRESKLCKIVEGNVVRLNSNNYLVKCDRLGNISLISEGDH